MISLTSVKALYTQSPLIIKRLVGFLPKSFLFGEAYRERICELNKLVALSSSQVEDYQADRLKKLLVYANKNIPFYKNRFNDFDTRMSTMEVGEYYSNIETLNRQDVASNLTDFCNPLIHSSNLYYATTGGTSGKPVTICYNKNAYSIEWAVKHWYWQRYFNIQESDKRAVFRGVEMSGGTLFYENPIYNEIRVSPFVSTIHQFEKIYEKLLTYKPTILHGYPSAIFEFSKFCDSKKLKLSSVKGVLLISENVRETQVSEIKRVFDCDVYDFYGHSERLVFAVKNPKDGVYIPCPVYGITELLETGDSSLHEITGTGFSNRAMVLFRYRTGDYAIPFKQKAVSRFAPHFKSLVGRWNQEYLLSSKGEKVSLTSLNMHGEIYGKLKFLQYVQKENGVVQINVVPDKKLTEKDKLSILEDHSFKLKYNFSIEMKILSSPLKTATGKVPFLLKSGSSE